MFKRTTGMAPGAYRKRFRIPEFVQPENAKYSDLRMSPYRMLNRRRFLTTTAAGFGGISTLIAIGQLTAADREVLPAPHIPTPHAWDDNAITLAWLGHATVLINFYGLRVLTDPALFRRIGVDVWFRSIGPLRVTAAALEPSQLPEIDLVLVSHAHFDHLDTPSLAAVRGRPAAIMAVETSDLLPRRRYASVQELRWGESARIRTARGDVEVTSLEVKHWGARLRRDTYRGYNGYVIRREGRALLFGGDTAHTPLFSSYRRHGPFEAAIMPIGAYDPFIRNHCTPEQSVAMADVAGARLFVPIHHKSFQLGREPFEEPIERTQAALAAEADRLAVRDVGDTVRLA
jgi:L-ascorbate metabolism protein UlaG (beta-lactamase superfamily)